MTEIPATETETGAIPPACRCAHAEIMHPLGVRVCVVPACGCQVYRPGTPRPTQPLEHDSRATVTTTRQDTR